LLALIFMVSMSAFGQVNVPMIKGVDEHYQAAIEALAQGDKPLTERLLREVVQLSPAHAGAWLDLALLYCDAGQSAEALALFEKIEEELQAPPGIKALISQARARGCNPQRRWLKQSQLSVGRDSNVNYAPMDSVIRFAATAPFPELVLGPQNRPKADWFGLAEIFFTLPAATENWAGAQWQGMLQGKNYQSEHDFNTISATLGASWQGVQNLKSPLSNLGIHLWELSAFLSHSQMGGRAYDTNAHFLAGSWSSDLNNSTTSWRWGWEGGLSQYQYAQSNLYNATRLDWRARAQIRHNLFGKFHSLSGSFGPVMDWANTNRPGGDRFGYRFLAQWSTIWSPEHETVVFMQQQNLKESQAYSPAFFGDQKRYPKTGQWGARYTQHMWREAAWYAQYQAQTVNDKINLFSYKNQSFTIGFQRIF
jgi:hypothetical protein